MPHFNLYAILKMYLDVSKMYFSSSFIFFSFNNYYISETPAQIKMTTGRGQNIIAPTRNITTAYVGETITLTCSLGQLRYSHDLEWYIGPRSVENVMSNFPPRTLEVGPPKTSRPVIFETDYASGVSTLTLTDVGEEDAKQYSCNYRSEPHAELHLVITTDVNETSSKYLSFI